MDKERLLDVNQLVEILGISQRGIWRFRDSGQMPAPVTLGRLVRWRSGDIEAWIDEGCPDCRRKKWISPKEHRCNLCQKGGCHE